MKHPKNDDLFDQLQQTGQFIWINFVRRLHKSRDPIWDGDKIALRLVDQAIKELEALAPEKRVTGAAAIIVGLLFQFSLTGDEEHDAL